MADRVLELRIDGMHCDACVRRVTRTLSGLAGVKVKQVSIGDARVAYDPASTNESQIMSAIVDAGFEARANA